ncbi:DUF5667 domain-containing protein [Actinoplanes sp. NPDC051633]|uniref:DUF5667 domain-containing protein n=1 Tax=Actinoplanes sp. NPDC051633 TaxID=3155670 RepID=UPI003432B2A2
MSFDFLDRRRAERFAELLDEPGSAFSQVRGGGGAADGGRRHHSRGQADGELAELVAIGHSLSAVRTSAHVGDEFRTGLRAMLVATAERDGIGHAAETGTTGGHAAVREPRRSLLSLSGRRIRARGAIVIGVAAGAMAVSGISAASENAAPGDALYGVKRSTEKAQLAMAGSDVTRGQLSLDFAKTRLTEAAALPPGAGGFAGVLDDMDADTRQGVKLLTEAAVARQDNTPLSRIDAFTTGQRQTFAPVLDSLVPADRTRAESSLALLDDVTKRTESLRAGLSCATVTRAGTDSLGPWLKDCIDGQDSSGTSDATPGHGQKPGAKPGTGSTGDQNRKAEPEKTDPAATEPDVQEPTDGATTPGNDRKRVTPAETPDDRQQPTPDRSVPADDADEDDGLLDGVIGKLFG